MSPDIFIKKAVEKIKMSINPEKIILFGSYAYGNPDISSDIDFFILLNSYEKPVKRRIKVSKLFLDREYPLDFIVYNQEELSEEKFSMKKVSEWIQRAENDFDTVEILLKENSKSYEIICFHCQQCIEKYLKAFLIANNKSFPKIHDLVKLTGICNEVDTSFSELSEDLAELNEYAVATRYPGEVVDIKDVKNSYRITKEARKFLKIKFS
jgi:HEPN domain-containing protein